RIDAHLDPVASLLVRGRVQVDLAHDPLTVLRDDPVPPDTPALERGHGPDVELAVVGIGERVVVHFVGHGVPPCVIVRRSLQPLLSTGPRNHQAAWPTRDRARPLSYWSSRRRENGFQ